jgi:hypothetical protein
MQIILAIGLAITAYLLFSSKFGDKALERASNVGGIVATVAAIIVLALYTFPSEQQQDVRATAAPQLNPTIVVADTLTPSPPPSNTPNPTATLITSSAPIVDSIEFPKSIVCDGTRYDVPIRFHDPDGDAHRVQWELLYTKKQTPLFSDAVEFFIDAEEQIIGATFHDFLEWYIPGDEVRIRVYIEDRLKQTGFMDFEFKCSN